MEVAKATMMEAGRTPILVETEVVNLAQVQNRLAASLLEWARANQLAAKDWVKGGWTRSSDKIDIGWRVAGALQESM